MKVKWTQNHVNDCFYYLYVQYPMVLEGNLYVPDKEKPAITGYKEFELNGDNKEFFKKFLRKCGVEVSHEKWEKKLKDYKYSGPGVEFVKDDDVIYSLGGIRELVDSFWEMYFNKEEKNAHIDELKEALDMIWSIAPQAGNRGCYNVYIAINKDEMSDEEISGIEYMKEFKFEDVVDFSNVSIDKSIAAGNKLLDLLKEAGTKDAYMSGRLAVLLADLPDYEAKADKTLDKPTMLVGSISGINVHIYRVLTWNDNTVYYE